MSQTNYNTNLLPSTYYSTHAQGVKSNLFADQSSEGRLHRLKERAKNATKQTWAQSYPVKNTTETTTLNAAIRRVRNRGYVVPNKVTQKHLL